MNDSSEPILQAVVVVCGQGITFDNIPPGESRNGSYEVRSDSHYHITVEFQSGTRIVRDIGYVTNGMDFSDRITVTPGDIEISELNSSE